MAIAIGSNVGDAMDHIAQGIEQLQALISDIQCSGIYRTAPMYVTDQSDFLNGVMIGTTDLGPIELVAELKRIEREIGRTARYVNGPREIDLDLVVYGSLVLRSSGSPAIQVPHPRMHERKFVLQPLIECWPDVSVPKLDANEALRTKFVQSQYTERVCDAPVRISSN